jgi:hypothetical protein
MRTPRFLIGAVAFLVLRAMPVHAQSLEVGAGLGVSCEPHEYSFCPRKWGTAVAVYGNWWVSDNIALELRGARLDGPQSRLIPVGEKTSDHSTFYRSYLLQRERRRMLQASFLYEFRSTHVVRPFLGGGPGVLWWAGDSSCPRSLIECSRVIPGGTASRLDETTLVLGFTGGVAFQAPNGVVVRSGVRGVSSWNEPARPARSDDLPRGLPEYFVSVGYRW